MIISLERRLLDASSGGVDGLGEPRGVPKTQILLTPPRVYQVPFGVLRSSRRRFTCPYGLVSVVLVLACLCLIYDTRMGVTH